MPINAKKCSWWRFSILRVDLKVKKSLIFYKKWPIIVIFGWVFLGKHDLKNLPIFGQKRGHFSINPTVNTQKSSHHHFSSNFIKIIISSNFIKTSNWLIKKWSNIFIKNKITKSQIGWSKNDQIFSSIFIIFTW